MCTLDDTNRDIRDYVSPFDFKFTLTQFIPGVLDRGELYFRFFLGGKYGTDFSDAGGQELGLSFRLGGLFLAPSLFAQYYHGYAESFLKYNEEVSRLRVGILL